VLQSPCETEKRMPTKLINVGGFLAEVEPTDSGARFIAGDIGKKMGIEQLRPILNAVCAPLLDTWKELSTQAHISEAEVEIGFSFEGEGNIYITKAKAGANLTVKMKFQALPEV
jgi:hypothetical protein